jgi:hypothetical protein
MLCQNHNSQRNMRMQYNKIREIEKRDKLQESKSIMISP